MTPEPPPTRWLWLRWSLRDLRRHGVAVVAIALVVAIGVGVYAGLGSTATWREVSNDESFEALAMHDVRVALDPGTFTDEASLFEAVAGVGEAASIEAMTERLVVDSQLDTGSELVAARLVGMDLAENAVVDRLWITDGARPEDDEPEAAVLEKKFADAVGLGSAGQVTVAGGTVIAYHGLGVIPEDFYYEGPEGTIFGQGELATVYLSLAGVQEVVGRPGQVNDLVLTVEEGVDPALLVEQITAAIETRTLSASVTTRDDATAVRVLYDDIENDQQFWNVLAGLVLFAAALAAFNLVNRIVEAQRREIGIGLALGVAPSRLAIRPMAIGLQVALFGVIAGVGVSFAVGRAMAAVFESFLPLPVYRTPFQLDVHVQAGLLGALVPLVASALPTLRAVRVEPIQAIRTGHLRATSGRLADRTGMVPLPGSTLTQMPVRNVLRTPRRTLLTALGVGAAVTALVAVLGMLDSFSRSIDTIGAELARGDPERVLVQLDTFHPEASDVVRGVEAAAGVGSVDGGLRLPATVTTPHHTDDLTLLVELIDLDRSQWTPTVGSGVAARAEVDAGIILAPKAATDLGVEPGDTVTLRHTRQLAPGRFETATSEVTVSGVHASPMRVFAFMDLSTADRFGLDGVVNFLHAHPGAAATNEQVQRSLYGVQGVAATQSIARIGESFDEALDQFVGILYVAAVAVFVLAVLIAFNATTITIEERRREHATMRAFGLPVGTVIGVVMKEAVLVGLLATAIGLVAGRIFLGWMLGSLASRTLPDLAIGAHLSLTTVGVAAIVGVLAVSVAPLLLVRRVSRMSIPDTLRVME